MLLERGRNEQCHCGSMKKYKKCCLNAAATDDFAGFSVVDINFPIEEFKDNREALTNEDEKCLDVFWLLARRGYLSSEEQRAEFHEQFMRMKQQYPNNPLILGYLYHLDKNFGRDAEAAFFLEEIKTRFPRYTHGIVIAVRLALAENNVDQALAYLQNSHTLKQFDPQRSVFHASEAAVFHRALVDCYIAKNDEPSVRRHYTNLVMLVSQYPDYNEYAEGARNDIDSWNDYRVRQLLAAIMENMPQYNEHQNG